VYVDAFLYKLILNFNLSCSINTRLPSYVFPSSARFISVRSSPMSGFAHETFKLNNIQKRLYSSGSKLSKYTPPLIEPWFVTGFTDAEGCFTFTLSKAPRNKIGWDLGLNFTINLHKRDENLLNLIKNYFGDVGTIGYSRGCCVLKVRSLNSIVTKIIPRGLPASSRFSGGRSHFDKYPLVTEKRADYFLWKEVVMMMQRGEHLTVEGLQSIVNIRASLNKGLKPALQEAFPNSVPVSRYISKAKEKSLIYAKLHPQWVAGFISGEGSFIVEIRKSKAYKAGGRVTLTFKFNQHTRYAST
jgi:hypothetical protein